jgi:cytochrome c2
MPKFAPILLLLFVASACDHTPADRRAHALTQADPDRGAALIPYYGCSSCHTIPGITGSTAVVGPPLSSFAERPYIAGVSPNTPDHVAQWIQNPKSLSAHTDMPNIGVNPPDARDIAAYLYTLR